jgi:hypothetical protein
MGASGSTALRGRAASRLAEQENVAKAQEVTSYPTLVGGLVVLAGTMIAFVGFLPGYERAGWRESSGAVGAAVIGLGTAASFVGSATHLNRTGYDILNWGLLGLALLLIVSILTPYYPPRFGLGKRNHEGKGHDKRADREDTEDDVAIYMTACEHRVSHHTDKKGTDDNPPRGESTPPFSKAH